MARCPAHDDRTPSLAITQTREGRVLVYCHAGCDQRDVLAALRARGLWGPSSKPRGRFRAGHSRQAPTRADLDAAKKTEAALAIWQAAQSAKGTLAENYLASRGLLIQPPGSLRFHGGLKHPSGGVWPAMVALVTGGFDGVPVGIHRTFLDRDGGGKAAVEPVKVMLGRCRGGAVRLGEVDDALMVGEGIETCLAAMQETGRVAWAALSTSGLRALNLPASVRNIVVLADGDAPGESAAQDCALRWKREGRNVRIARSPAGSDFNDLMLSRARLADGA
jgi:hypothetical protein